MTPQEIREALVNQTVVAVEASNGAEAGCIWAIKLESGKVYSFLTDWDDNVVMERDDQGVWFKGRQFEYEYLFEDDGSSPCVEGWVPIATDRIRHPENIEQLIATGKLRRISQEGIAGERP